MSRTFTQLSRPNWSSPVFSKPFTRKSLQIIRSALDSESTPIQPPPGWASQIKKGSAAVLIPFCNVNETPGILLQVRSRSMRSHSGEVRIVIYSFPGGKVDEALDLSLLDCALRECTEEMGIERQRIELLGALHPPERSLRGDTVWPFVGFVHREPCQSKVSPDFPADDPFPSLYMTMLERRASKDEVAAIFHLPLAELANPDRSRAYMFRNERPYWAVNVSDLVPGDGQPFISESLETPQVDEVGAGREGRLEIWGLTGWFLGLLAARLSSLHEL